MTAILRTIGAVAIVALTSGLGGVPANAAAAAGLFPRFDTEIQSSNLVHEAQYRGRYNNRRYGGDPGNRYRGNGGRNLALGIGGLIIGGIVLSEAARADHRRSHGSDWDRCAQTYRSFEPETGIYTGYDGQRHTCPYLR